MKPLSPAVPYGPLFVSRVVDDEERYVVRRVANGRNTLLGDIKKNPTDNPDVFTFHSKVWTHLTVEELQGICRFMEGRGDG